MDLKTLIYSKSYNSEVQQRLLKISSSSTWAEDLIDYIGELAEDCQDAEKEIKSLENKINNEEEFEISVNKFKEELRDIINEIINSNSLNLDSLKETFANVSQDEQDGLIIKLRKLIDHLIEKKITRKVAIIGGIVCPVDKWERIYGENKRI